MENNLLKTLEVFSFETGNPTNLFYDIPLKEYRFSKQKNTPKTKMFVNQHLYLVDSQNISLGDYYIDVRDGSISEHRPGNRYTKHFKKVIATTDEFLINSVDYIASIPEHFVRKYSYKNGDINFVEVELEYINGAIFTTAGGWDKNPLDYKKFPSGDIVISDPKEKTYKLEDLIKAYNCGYSDRDANKKPFDGEKPKEYLDFLGK